MFREHVAQTGMKMPTEAQMLAWERHVQESKRRAAARARLPKPDADKQTCVQTVMQTVQEEDEDFVLV